MLDIENIFQFKKMNVAKLKSLGFVDIGEYYSLKKDMLDSQFYIKISIAKETEKIDYAVFDKSSNEEYILVKAENAQGSFVGSVRNACEELLEAVAEAYFEREVYNVQQTKRIAQFIQEKYDALPEFLWNKYPSYAVFRHKSNKKWFAILMTIDSNKLDPSLNGPVEIIDLKANAETVSSLINEYPYFNAYHMNKKYWYTIILDGTLSDNELYERIAESFQLTS